MDGLRIASLVCLFAISLVQSACDSKAQKKARSDSAYYALTERSCKDTEASYARTMPEDQFWIGSCDAAITSEGPMTGPQINGRLGRIHDQRKWEFVKRVLWAEMPADQSVCVDHVIWPSRFFVRRHNLASLVWLSTETEKIENALKTVLGFVEAVCSRPDVQRLAVRYAYSEAENFALMASEEWQNPLRVPTEEQRREAAAAIFRILQSYNLVNRKFPLPRSMLFGVVFRSVGGQIELTPHIGCGGTLNGESSLNTDRSNAPFSSSPSGVFLERLRAALNIDAAVGKEAIFKRLVDSMPAAFKSACRESERRPSHDEFLPGFGGGTRGPTFLEIGMYRWQDASRDDRLSQFGEVYLRADTVRHLGLDLSPISCGSPAFLYYHRPTAASTSSVELQTADHFFILRTDSSGALSGEFFVTAGAALEPSPPCAFSLANLSGIVESIDPASGSIAEVLGEYLQFVSGYR